MFIDGEFGLDFVLLDKGRLLVRKRWLELFRRHGLENFADFMSFGRGKVLHERKGRMRMCISLESLDGKQVFYLKRHHAAGGFRRLAMSAGLISRVSAARRELRNIMHFAEAELATITVAAVGEAGAGGGSLIMSEELAGYLSLHHYLESSRSAAMRVGQPLPKRELIRALANYSRRLHEAGMDHRDMYLSHFFVRPEAPAESLKLLDLQRVRKHHRVWRHGQIKDLAALNYSAWQVGIPRTDRLRFFMEYVGVRSVKQFSTSQRRLLEVVARKTGRIHRHDRKTHGRGRCEPGR